MNSWVNLVHDRNVVSLREGGALLCLQLCMGGSILILEIESYKPVQPTQKQAVLNSMGLAVMGQPNPERSDHPGMQE